MEAKHELLREEVEYLRSYEAMWKDQKTANHLPPDRVMTEPKDFNLVHVQN